MAKEKKAVSRKSPVKSKKADPAKLVKDLTAKLLKEIGIEAKIAVESGEDHLLVKLETAEPGMVIGFHGETLSSLQLIIGMMAYRQRGEWTRVLVNVNDYRERRQENLEKIAFAAAERAKATGEAQSLLPMNSGERRLVHLALSEDKEITTESEGEGWQRHVVVKPRSGQT